MSKHASIGDLVIHQSKKAQTVAVAKIKHFEVYKDQEIPQEMAQRIRNAKKEVKLCFYKLLGDSDGGKMLIDALKDLAKKATPTKPINVTMLLNKRGFLAQMFYKNNPESHELKALQAFAHQHPYFQFKLVYHEAKAFNSYHAKQVIIDPTEENGTVMLCSGDFQADNNINHYQNETAILIEDKALAAIANHDFNRALSNAATSYKPKPQDEVILDNSPKCGNALYLTSKAYSSPLPHQDTAPFKDALLKSFQQAKHSICIITTNLNDPDIIEEIAQAANRGVTIKLVLGKFRNAQLEKFFGGTNLDNIRALYAKVKPECQKHLRIRWVMNPKTNQVVLDGESYSTHAKFCMVDQQLLFMGSSPLDKQAMQCSREIDVVIQVDEHRANDVLKKLFHEQYALARDYSVDRILSSLTASLVRLSRYKGDIAQSKRNALKKAIGLLSMPGITPTQAEKHLLTIKTVLSQKRNPWHAKKPHSLKMLEKCLARSVCHKHANDEADYGHALKFASQKIILPGNSNKDVLMQSTAPVPI